MNHFQGYFVLFSNNWKWIAIEDIEEDILIIVMVVREEHHWNIVNLEDSGDCIPIQMDISL